MVRVLLVANKTLGGGDVTEFVRNRMTEDECQFTLLVPATPPPDLEPEVRLTGGLASPGGGVVPSADMEFHYEYARSRLEYGLELLTGLGATVDGEVGDADPGKAINEMLGRRQFDEVALSTLPRGVSRWLRLDIPHQVERKFGVPVRVIKALS